MDKVIRIFSDGSSIGNPGPGGWGAVMVQDRKRWEMSGGVLRTTISEMELLAAIEPLRSLPSEARVELRSDSEFLIRGMRFFVQRWQSQSWRNRRGTAIQYRDRWEELLFLDSRLHVQWRWLKGHNHHPMQCRADELAYKAAREQWTSQRQAA